MVIAGKSQGAQVVGYAERATTEGRTATRQAETLNGKDVHNLMSTVVGLKGLGQTHHVRTSNRTIDVDIAITSLRVHDHHIHIPHSMTAIRWDW